MLFILAIVLLTGCSAATKKPWETPAAIPPHVVAPIPTDPRVLPAVDVAAEANTWLRITFKLPRDRRLAGPAGFRVSEMAGSGRIRFDGLERKFMIPKAPRSFPVAFLVREGTATIRFVVEYFHCPRTGEGACVKENGYYELSMNAAKGRGLTYVPVVVSP